jgi:hypothetical protein
MVLSIGKEENQAKPNLIINANNRPIISKTNFKGEIERLWWGSEKVLLNKFTYL